MNFKIKLESFVEKISSNIYLQSISKGMVGTISLTLLGSILGLLKFIPIDNIFYNNLLDIGLLFTSNLLAFWAIFFISGNLANEYKKSRREAGILGIYAYLILLPITQRDYLELTWLGPRGTVAGIVLALIATRIYIVIDDFIDKSSLNRDSLYDVKKMTILLLVFTFVFLIIRILISLTIYEYYVILISRTILVPLQYLGGTLPGIIIAVAITNLLFYFGIHGATIVLPFMSPVWVSFGVDNLLARASNQASPHIIESGLFRIYSELGGGASTISLLLVIHIFAKSKKYKNARKVFGPSSLVSIGEPMIFGMPMVGNKDFLIPMVLNPVISIVIAYLAINFELVPRLAGITVPNGVPVFVDGFIAGGYKHSMLQGLIIVINAFVYLPFFIKSDHAELAKDKKSL